MSINSKTLCDSHIDFEVKTIKLMKEMNHHVSLSTKYLNSKDMKILKSSDSSRHSSIYGRRSPRNIIHVSIRSSMETRSKSNRCKRLVTGSHSNECVHISVCSSLIAVLYI